MVRTPRPLPRPSQLGHGVYLRECSGWPGGNECLAGPRPGSSQRTSHYLLSVSIFCVKRRVETIGTKWVIVTSVQRVHSCAFCSVYFSENRRQREQPFLPPRSQVAGPRSGAQVATCPLASGRRCQLTLLCSPPRSGPRSRSWLSAGRPGRLNRPDPGHRRLGPAAFPQLRGKAGRSLLRTENHAEVPRRRGGEGAGSEQGGWLSPLLPHLQLSDHSCVSCVRGRRHNIKEKPH